MGILEKTIILKMCLNRAYSHIGLPFNIAQNAMLVYLFIQGLEVPNPMLWAVVSSVLLILGMALIGYLDVTKGIYELENTINNRHNPELMRAAGKKK